jgi:HD-GYP domain-containing protein (c-di-GMP phosphodiesterase class II)
MLNVDLNGLLLSLSAAMDYTRRGIGHHHLRVACLCRHFAGELGLPEEERKKLFRAALLHDCGASTFSEKDALADFETERPWDHSRRGAELLLLSSVLCELAPVVASHHDRYGGENPSGLMGEGIPLAARIIHLADRIDVLAGERPEEAPRSETVERIGRLAGTVFDPVLVEVFGRLQEKEAFWLDLQPQFLAAAIKEELWRGEACGLDDVLEIGEIYARVIDAKSPFTHRHSRGVALVAEELGRVLGFGGERARMLALAGLLHDLGKLAIPEEILDKPAALNREEVALMRRHSYISYRLLQGVDGLAEVAAWAGFHHETLNGRGYPFGLAAKDLSLESRVVSLADKFVALTEERPYRPPLPPARVRAVLQNMAAQAQVDGELYLLLEKRLEEMQERVRAVTAETVVAKDFV